MQTRVDRSIIVACALLPVLAHAVTVTGPPPVQAEARQLPVPSLPPPRGSETLPPSVQAQVDSGRRALQAGDLSAAENAFLAAAKSQPRAYSPYLGLADVALRRNRTGDAAGFMSKALAKGPASAEVAAAAGRLAYGLGKPEAAEKQFRRAIDIDPQFVTPYTDLGELHLAQGRTDDAVRDFTDAIKASPRHAGARFGLGRAYAARGNLEQASSAFEESARLAPGTALPLIALAEVQQRQGRTDAALASLDRAQKVEPRNLNVVTSRADVLVAGGRREQAVALLQSTATATPAPQSAGLWLKLGVVQQGAGSLADAQAAYRKGTEADAQLALAHNGFAWVAATRKQDLDEAIQHAMRAVQLQPQAATFQDTLGFVHQARGEIDEAVAAYRQAVKLSPQVPDFQYRLGVALQARGDKRAAADSFRAALAINKPFDGQGDARKRLQALGASR